MQRIVHPDFHGGSSKELAGEAVVASSTLNAAFHTLRNPHSRAQYLLRIQGEDTQGEGGEESRAVSPLLLMEVMEARELVEDPSTPLRSLQRMRVRAEEAVGKCVGDLSEAFREEGGSGRARARNITVALSYYHKLVEEVDAVLEVREAKEGPR